ncbi:hypothetical protein ACJMK2_030939 [Sinanodonta woodiana]|uniref:Endonuclease V n=1 Tax=Sinanodonta woodiana TaxID=1069815 RepID=A0ABD3X187_SINWO
MDYKPQSQGRDLDTTVTEEVKVQWEKEQEELRQKLSLEDADVIKKLLAVSDTDQSASNEEKFYIAGVDISFVKDDNVNACAAIVIVRFPDLQLMYEDCEMVKLTAPYIPGYLAFRECPFILKQLEQLSKKKPFYNPQVQFGLACHLGVVSDIPCIGVAKKLFQVDGLEKDDRHHTKIKNLKKGGDTFPLQGSSGRVLGMALRSCDSTKNPVYVSPGHKISLESAVKLVHRCCQHRVPEPIRWADIKSREYIRENFITMDQENRSDVKKLKSHHKKNGKAENEKIIKLEKNVTSDDTCNLMFEDSLDLFYAQNVIEDQETKTHKACQKKNRRDEIYGCYNDALISMDGLNCTLIFRFLCHSFWHTISSVQRVAQLLIDYHEAWQI